MNLLLEGEPRRSEMLVENESFNAHRPLTNIEKRGLAGIGRKGTKVEC